MFAFAIFGAPSELSTAKHRPIDDCNPGVGHYLTNTLNSCPPPTACHVPPIRMLIKLFTTSSVVFCSCCWLVCRSHGRIMRSGALAGWHSMPCNVSRKVLIVAFTCAWAGCGIMITCWRHTPITKTTSAAAAAAMVATMDTRVLWLYVDDGRRRPLPGARTQSNQYRV